MYQNLLLPLDLTDKNEQAVRTASELVEKTGGRVTLLHVIELIPGLPRDEDRAFYDRLERAAQAHLDTVGKDFLKQKIPCQSVIQFGHRVEETVRYAKETGCDLIVVTAPTFDPAHPSVGWGSLSFKISVLSPVPLLMVKA
jgi:nucleotide-binding universal stress UspA family protein